MYLMKTWDVLYFLDCVRTFGLESCLKAVKLKESINKVIQSGKNENLDLTSVIYEEIKSKNENLYSIIIKMPDFKVDPTLMKDIEENLDKIDEYILNVQKLIAKSIDSITYDASKRFSTEIFYGPTGEISDMRKHYSDSEIKVLNTKEKENRFERYLLGVNDSSYILESEIHEDGRVYTYFHVNSLSFDTKSIPDEEEFRKMDLPHYISDFRNKPTR